MCVHIICRSIQFFNVYNLYQSCNVFYESLHSLTRSDILYLSCLPKFSFVLPTRSETILQKLQSVQNCYSLLEI